MCAATGILLITRVNDFSGRSSTEMNHAEVNKHFELSKC